MEVKELQVGDWVKATYEVLEDKNVGRIDTILRGIAEIQIGEDTICATFLHIEPIPLTDEILEKNGCYELDSNHYIGKSIGNVFNFIMAFEECDEVIVSIKYVHELQHILKVFNIDKEITVE